MVAPESFSIDSTRDNSSATSSLVPSTSHNKSASASSGYPAFTKSSTAATAGPSIISRPAGMIPAAMMPPTESPAFVTSSKAAMTTRISSGLGNNRTVTSNTTAKSPSLPIVRASKSYPAESNASEPTVTIEPSSNATVIDKTLWTVNPYLRQWTPPEFSAIFPPIEQAIWDDGSGA